MALWQRKHLGTWCMWYTVSFLTIYKNLLAKFSYVYAGAFLETEGSIQQSSSVNNCCFIAISYLNLTIKKELQEEVKVSMKCPKEFWLTRFQVLYNASTHWPILSYNLFCQIQYLHFLPNIEVAYTPIRFSSGARAYPYIKLPIED